MTPVSCKEINLKIYSGSGVLSVFHRMHTFYRRNVLYCFIFLCLCIVSHILWLWISSIECHVCDLIFFLKVNKIKKLHETAFFVSFPSLKECSTWLKELVNTKRFTVKNYNLCPNLATFNSVPQSKTLTFFKK